MKPEEAVGLSVRVLWPDENAWFAGTVESYDPETGKHKARSFADPPSS